MPKYLKPFCTDPNHYEFLRDASLGNATTYISWKDGDDASYAESLGKRKMRELSSSDWALSGYLIYDDPEYFKPKSFENFHHQLYIPVELTDLGKKAKLAIDMNYVWNTKTHTIDFEATIEHYRDFLRQRAICTGLANVIKSFPDQELQGLIDWRINVLYSF